MKRPPATLPAQVTLTRAVPGGEAMGLLPNGQVVFVPGAFAGEQVDIEALSVHKGFARATKWQLSAPSALRRPSPCAISAQCGGCDWIELQAGAQAAQKLQLVRDALTRVGKLPPDKLPSEVISAGEPLGYRTRLRLHVAEQGGLGLLARGSHAHVPVTQCAVCTPEVNRALLALQSFFVAPEPLLAEACQVFGQVELRVLAQARGEVFLYVHDSVRVTPQRAEQLRPWLTRLRAQFAVRASREGFDLPVLPPTAVPLLVGDSKPLQLSVVPGVFTQVNWQINQRLIADLVDQAKRAGVQSFLDLYCGAGNLSLPLLGAGIAGMGVEENPEAIACARRAAEAAGLAARFEAAPVAAEAQRLLRSGATFDLVVVDPPRAGVGSALPAVARLATRSLFYCACDPVSLARDAHWLVGHGYSLQHVQVYDMFPQTHHAEVTAWFERNLPLRRDPPRATQRA